MNTTELVVEMRPEKIQARWGFERMTSAVHFRPFPVDRFYLQNYSLLLEMWSFPETPFHSVQFLSWYPIPQCFFQLRHRLKKGSSDSTANS